MNCDEIDNAINPDAAACGFHCFKMNQVTVKSGKTILVNNINIHIHCGKLTVIIGPNGAGKTTLIKAIIGEIPYSGTIEFKDTREHEVKDLKIGYVPQYVNVDANNPTSVYDMFASYISNVPIFLKKKKTLYNKILTQLQLFGAIDLIDKRVGDLSGGEMQRVLLAIACTPVPNLLLLDEPVSGIDKNGLDLFYSHINMLKERYDLSILLVSHDFEFVREYADYVILMDKTIIKEGRQEQVLLSKEYRHLFNNT